MTRRQRVIDAINHKETDIIPFQVNFTQQEHDIVAQYLGDPDFYDKIGVHIELASYAGFPTEDPKNPGYFKDDFGVIWNRNGVDKDIGMIEKVLFDEPDIRKYKFPELDKAKIHAMYKELMNNGHDTFKVGRISFALYERAWSLRGIENLLADMLLAPDFVEELLDAICDYNMQIIDIGLSYDIDGFYFGDDWGQQLGLIMGPKTWRKFIKPRMARMYEKIKSKGKYVIQHSCGDNSEIFPDLIEIGLDVYQTFQPEIYDIKKMKKEYGDKLTFWGAISTQRLLPYATPQQVKETTIEIMKILGEGGGYIAGPTHWVPCDVPPENIVAMLEVFQNQSLYLR